MFHSFQELRKFNSLKQWVHDFFFFWRSECIKLLLFIEKSHLKSIKIKSWGINNFHFFSPIEMHRTRQTSKAEVIFRDVKWSTPCFLYQKSTEEEKYRDCTLLKVQLTLVLFHCLGGEEQRGPSRYLKSIFLSFFL